MQSERREGGGGAHRRDIDRCRDAAAPPPATAAADRDRHASYDAIQDDTANDLVEHFDADVDPEDGDPDRPIDPGPGNGNK
ncbi:hypothetical protein CIW52_02040 [Mycolicibacterium sp. P9-64]|uniref:hypothetical protein n=1 Tax=Mycolicibacterium sp. P9-64 TaxID=2024612 RepID=UPI0011ECFCF3|nr:hypothetical protein [Mycolicibacterium sp. P9-64]KAA0086714.1 hypothetical protein CIW52_02040 [Mycolicibacterium sp. P9-64]